MSFFLMKGTFHDALLNSICYCNVRGGSGTMIHVSLERPSLLRSEHCHCTSGLDIVSGCSISLGAL